MKRKGFTLIELLAVIVVLAIIALIATPIVMNAIEKSKKGAAERTADSYVRAVETDIATAYVENGFFGEVSETIPVEDLNEFIEIKGDKPTSGWVEVEQGVVIDYVLEIGDYTVIYDKDKKAGVATKTITYDIELNLTNVISDDSNVNKITNLFPTALRFTAQEGYNLPDNVEVEGATYTWNKEVGILVLSKVTGNVKITISGVAMMKVYRLSTDTIKTGDTVDPSDTTKFTTDPSKLGEKYYLKHVLDKDNKVTGSYACAIVNSKEYCLKNGEHGYAENEADYTGSALILKNLRDENIEGMNCYLDLYGSNCNDGSVSLSASSGGFVAVGKVGGGYCEVKDFGSSYCASN